LLAVRLRRSKLEYRAHWLGFDIDLDWYLASNFKYSPDKLREFHLANQTRDGPPRLLKEWTKTGKERKDDYDDLEDDRPMTEDWRASFCPRGRWGDVKALAQLSRAFSQPLFRLPSVA
jgi:hypothetical protein